MKRAQEKLPSDPVAVRNKIFFYIAWVLGLYGDILWLRYYIHHINLVLRDNTNTNSKIAQPRRKQDESGEAQMGVVEGVVIQS